MDARTLPRKTKQGKAQIKLIREIHIKLVADRIPDIGEINHSEVARIFATKDCIDCGQPVKPPAKKYCPKCQETRIKRGLYFRKKKIKQKS